MYNGSPVIGVALVPDHDPASIDHWVTVLSGFPGVQVFSVGTPPDWWAGHKTVRDAIPIEETDSPIVIVSPEGARKLPGTVSLVDYTHLDDVIYLFGGDHSILTTELSYADSLYIPSDGAEFYSHVAGAIVLYDRMLKSG